MKNKLIQCAQEVYLENGYSGFSMRKVGLKAGVTATAIYRHFENKNELLHHVLLEGFKKFASYISAAKDKDTPIECLKTSGRQYLNFALENPSFYKIMYMSTDDLHEVRSFTAEGETEIRATFQIHLDYVTNCNFKSGDARTIALSLWSLCHGMVSLYFASRLREMSKIEFIEFFILSMDKYIDSL